MAFMNQERKTALLPGIKAVLKKYGIKASVAVRHHSTLVINISHGPIDFNAERAGKWAEGFVYNGHIDVNPYHVNDHYTGTAKAFLAELIDAANVGNHDRNDLQTDYFDVGWYVDVNVGKWNKPYIVESAKVAA